MIGIERIGRVDVKKYDMNFAIVRSMRREVVGVKQMDVLSPSKELFWAYRDLVKKGMWNENAFKSMYVPRFLQEMQSAEARAALNALVKLDRMGKKISLSCFCEVEKDCHRSIVAGLLKGAGCDVRTASGCDYAHYWDMYTSLAR